MRSSLLLLLLVSLAGCRTRIDGHPRDWYAGGAFSAVPGVGFAGGGGKVLWRRETHDWAAEAQIVRHPLDDTDLADDNLGASGRMTAVRAGFKHRLSPGHKRGAVFRYGFQFYRATGSPGIVDDPGDYYGGYASVGFESELSRRWTMGPEISVAILEGEGALGVEVVPTFFWNLIYNF